MNSRATILLAASTFAFAAHAQTAAQNSVPLCKAQDISLATDQENGAFDGMSHSGTLLVLRNQSDHACRVAPFPQITFADATHELVAASSVEGARGLNHGPVVFPIILASGAELTAKLRWVSNDVFENNVCVAPTRLTVKIGDGTQTTTVQFRLCGDSAKGAPAYIMTRWATDPTYKPEP